MFDLKGKTALVTGATQGIGFEIARLLAEQGAKVFVHGRADLEKCTRAAEKIKGSIPVVADLSQKDCAEVLYEKTGAVDILVLNASVQYKKQWDAYSPEEFDMQMTATFAPRIF